MPPINPEPLQTNITLPPNNPEPPQTTIALLPINIEHPWTKMESESEKPLVKPSVCVICTSPYITEALVNSIGQDEECLVLKEFPTANHRLEGAVIASMDPKIDQPGHRAGDLVVCSKPPALDMKRSTRGALTRAAAVLRDEAGADFRWILDGSEHSEFRVHYVQDLDMGLDMDVPFPAATELETVGVYGVSDESAYRDPESVGEVAGPGTNTSPSLHESKMVAAVNVGYYTKELYKGIDSPLWKDTESLRGTESVVPAPLTAPAPAPFTVAPFHKWGDAILLVIPTKNKFKTTVLTEKFQKNLPAGKVLHTLALPADSGVGEQPYNQAGADGARQRISSALELLRTEEQEQKRRQLEIGTVVVASIENYMQTDGGVARPTDYGIVSFYNCDSGVCKIGVSRGVTVSPDYVERAKRYGFEDKEGIHGRVTVGQVMAANVPGLDKADWHKVVAGVSRYDLLAEAVDKMEISW